MPGRVNKTAEAIFRVKCVANSCHYWENGDRCRAESIEISSAEGNQNTDCATFIPESKV